MSARMRPRFEVMVPCSSRAAAERIDAALGHADARCRGKVFGSHAVLYVPREEERVWSPFLSLDLVGVGDGTFVRGLFGPKPSVWTFFMACYAVCAFLALAALGFAYAQWSIGQPLWALSVVGLAALGALATYGFARYGQWRGHTQMDALRRFLDDALGSLES